MNGTDEVEAPRARNPLFAPVRLVLHTVIKVLVLVVLGVRFLLGQRLVRYGLPVLAVVGIVGWQLVGGLLPKSDAQPLVGVGSGQVGGLPIGQLEGGLPSSAVVERYLQAEAAYDGVTMWGLLGDNMKGSLEANGGIANAQQLQAQMEVVKAQGRKTLGATYIGGKGLADGASVYFYVVKVGDGSTSVEVPYIYLLGPDGKIAAIQ